MMVPPAVPSKVIGFTVMVRTPEPMSILPAVMIEGPATLLEEAVMSPLRVSTPPVVAKLGAAPPLLLKARPARVLAPVKVSVEPPLRVTMLLEPIWPAVPIVTAAPLMIRPLAGVAALGITTTAADPVVFTVPPLRVVPPL